MEVEVSSPARAFSSSLSWIYVFLTHALREENTVTAHLTYSHFFFISRDKHSTSACPVLISYHILPGYRPYTSAAVDGGNSRKFSQSSRVFDIEEIQKHLTETGSTSPLLSGSQEHKKT
ncbi:hypothetical protein RRG08_044092 [Elysia crispata]|uniref:Uncharacterized protein n=1 Tax=Elysia crispata TaxID=231223 RepID=A0AAE0Z7G5_9GAST|nr:hypothetical protein RRG08_044092 [Elysia crispata]